MKLGIVSKRNPLERERVRERYISSFLESCTVLFNLIEVGSLAEESQQHTYAVSQPIQNAQKGGATNHPTVKKILLG